MGRSDSLLARGRNLCALMLVVSFAGCSGAGTSSIIPATGTSSSAAATQSAAAQRHTHVSINSPGDSGPNPCLADPISCGTGIGCDASIGNCGGFAYPPPSGFGGDGSGGDTSLPPPAQPSSRPKSPAELACNAAGGVFYTNASGGTTCKKPTDSITSLIVVSGCPGYTVTLNARGTGGTVNLPPSLMGFLFTNPSFGPGGGAQFNADCSFNVYQGSSN